MDPSQTIASIRNFYTQNETLVGSSQEFSIGALACKVAVVKDTSFYKVRNTALELILVAGKEMDYEALKKFAVQVHTTNTPVTSICVETLTTQHGGKMTNCREQFVPRSPSSTSMVSSASYGYTSKPSQSHSEAPSVKKIANEAFEEDYVLKNQTQSLEATDCIFNGDLRICADMVLTRVNAIYEVSSKKGSITATESYFSDVVIARFTDASITLKNCWASKVYSRGKILWENDLVRDTVAEYIDCEKGSINLKGIRALKVTSAETLKAENCDISFAEACGTVTLNKTTLKKLELKVPVAPLCEITINDSTIDELIIADHPYTIDGQKHATHSVSLLPPTFNYPKKDMLGSLSENASGRIEGIPYQFVDGEYIPGVKLKIIGSGTIKTITFQNCTKHSVVKVEK